MSEERWWWLRVRVVVAYGLGVGPFFLHLH